MNYELKSIAPGTLFFNAIRIFLIVGFLVAIISFFIVPNPNLRIVGFFPKLAATLLFTLVYGVVISLIVTLIAWLYNLWAGKFKGVSIRLEQQE
jgi:hypothetical protein